MKKLLYILPMFLLLAACGGEEEEKDQREPVKLESFEDRLSYTLGALEAKEIMESNDPNTDRYDKAMMLEGFKEGYKPGFIAGPENPCVQTIQNLFGVQGMDFDTTYLKEGCKCIGNFTSGMFYQQLEQIGELGRIDKELLYRGFEDGLYGNDTVISKADKMTVIEEFNKQVSARMQQEQDQHLQELSAVEAPKWEEIKAIPGIREMEGGVMVQTLKKGSGASPTAADDVDASYILSNFKGEVMQNSADVTPDGRYKTNIGTGVIRGWTIGFQAMQKGGRYKLYVPAELAYRQESLVFEIELFDFGPAGTLAPPPQQQGY